MQMKMTGYYSSLIQHCVKKSYNYANAIAITESSPTLLKSTYSQLDVKRLSWVIFTLSNKALPYTIPVISLNQEFT